MRNWLMRRRIRRMLRGMSKGSLSEKELGELFENYRGHSLWKAVVFLVDDRTMKSLYMCLDPKLSDRERAFYTGSVDSLAALRGEINNFSGKVVEGKK